MTAPLRRTLLCLLVAALAFLAHAPLFGSGFVGGDLELLAEAAGRAQPGAVEPSAWLARGAVRPIPAAVLRAHADLFAGRSPLEPAVAAPYFAFALAALLVAAAGAGVTLRRVLVPWLGESAARAAGWACAGLVVAHPASVAAVARPIALGDLLALAAGTWCTAFFLRGRQQRRDRFLVMSAVLAILAGFASSAAWLLPFACGALEYTSAHRPRRLPTKLAAAATVALSAAVAVAIEGFAWSPGGGARPGTPWSSIESASGSRAGFDFVDALKSLGLLFFPAPSPGAAGAFLACGVALLLAAEPVLRAVRAAPRLWGWLALGWMSGIAIVLLFALDVAVAPTRIELASAWMPATILVSAALATAATALGGSRRTVVPLAIAAVLCILSDRTSRLWPDASRALLGLREDLARGLATAGADGVAYVVGAPGGGALEGDGRRRIADDFAAPQDLALIAGAWPPTRDWPSRLPRVDAEDVPYLVRAPSAEELRRRGLAVLLLDREERPAFLIPPANGEHKAQTFRELDYGKSPARLEFDPVAMTMVRVTPRVGISTAEPPRMRWIARNALYENGTIEGAWVMGEDGPVAVFDLWRSNEWLLGGTIKRLLFEKELMKIVKAEIVPVIALDGLHEQDLHFDFAVSEAARPKAWSGEPEWVSVVVSPEAAAAIERPGRVAPDGSIELLFDCGLRNGGPPYALVECRVDGVTVARTPPLGGPRR